MKKSIKSKPNNSFDLEILRQKIRKMTRQQKLYKILKEELSKKGYWKKLPRGDAKKAGLASKEKRLKNGECRISKEI